MLSGDHCAMGDAMPRNRLTPGRRSETGSTPTWRGRPRRGSAGCRAALLALVLGAGAAACDDRFTPFAPDAQRLSVWGYLEVTRDTQWIRIGSLRPTVVTSGDSLPLQA